MFNRIKESIKKSVRQESFEERRKRMFPGAFYCMFAATVFVVVSSIINVISFQGMHLGLDWINLLIQLVEFCIAMAVAWAVVGWFTEDYMGIVGGGVALTILLLIGNLVTTLNGSGSAALTIQSIFTALPLVGVGVLLAWAIRVAVNRHLLIHQQETQKARRTLFARLVAIIFLVALIPGVFSRFGYSSEYAIRSLNDNLQNYATDPYFAYRYPFAKVPELKDHFGMKYVLYVHSSTYETNALDVTIRFGDGYAVTCIVPVTSGNAMILQVCNRGTQILSP
jgi:hypothetical protein